MTEIFLILMACAISWLLTLIFTASLSTASLVAFYVVGALILLEIGVWIFQVIGFAGDSVSRNLGYRRYMKNEQKLEQIKEERFQFLLQIPQDGYQASLSEDDKYQEYQSLEYLNSDWVKRPRFYTLSTKGKDFLSRVQKEKDELAKWN